MELEDIKVVWDSQNEEKLYALDERALYKQIKRKGKSISRWLQHFEMLMIGVNVVVAVILMAVEFLNGGELYGYLLSGVYLAYAVLATIWRQTRRQQDSLFEQTMMGELNKTIWQANYLIERSRGLTWWYLLPLMILIAVQMLYSGQPLFTLAFILMMGGVSILAARWEIKKKYLPQKQSLESLRATLLRAEI
ncbi:MAG: hypothetical protein KDE58_40585 [Caldilineaceae bacterium]|nr:hypothetical protein [Caldilineaceae bacterium]